ncbi:uncharacterized protein LOC111258908 isoform X2 [Varroa jacobsoni]|uniref:uncharacterized protein LOC111258908 isoform X2 n=1 Tax=Varroa jacobsoni TaxID=62625 RepID=UPI000BF3D49C|nr:uncharacterized protein LOC111258908 isoform X2 [Varroa jacobsoni]
MNWQVSLNQPPSMGVSLSTIMWKAHKLPFRCFWVFLRLLADPLSSTIIPRRIHRSTSSEASIHTTYILHLHQKLLIRYTARRKMAAWAALDPLHRSTASLPYSIEYHHVGHPLATAHSQSTTFHKFNSSTLGSSSANSSQRRKRRSIRSNRSGGGGHRASYQNPVTRLIDRYVDTSSQDSYNHLAEYLKTTSPAIENSHGQSSGSIPLSVGTSNGVHGPNIQGISYHGGQVNQAYENRYSIASSGTYGVVDAGPSPPYTPSYNPHHVQSPHAQTVSTNSSSNNINTNSQGITNHNKNTSSPAAGQQQHHYHGEVATLGSHLQHLNLSHPPARNVETNM